MKWYLKCFKQYADFSGRARRREYWMFVLFNCIFALTALAMDKVIMTNWHVPTPVCCITCLMAMMLPSFAATVRRLHDGGKSGWWALIGLIPLAGAIWLFVLLLQESQSGDNRYGTNPKISPHKPDEKAQLLNVSVVVIVAGAVGTVSWCLGNFPYFSILFVSEAIFIFKVFGNLIMHLLFLTVGLLLFPHRSSGHLSLTETVRKAAAAMVIFAAFKLLIALWNVATMPLIYTAPHILFDMLLNVSFLIFAVALLRSNRKLIRPASVVLMITAAVSILLNMLYNISLGVEQGNNNPVNILLFYLYFAPFFPISTMLLAGLFLSDSTGQNLAVSQTAFNSVATFVPATEAAANDCQPAVILIIRDKRYVGSNANVTVELNGVPVGRMANKSFILCKTTGVNNIVSLKEFKKDIHIQAKGGEKILLRYHYSGLSTVHTEVEPGVEYRKLREVITEISKGLGTGSLLGSLLVGGFFIWGGVSKQLVLRFTDKHSDIVTVLGIIIALGGIVSFIMRLKKENAVVTLDRFLKEAGHPESSND